jgi:hypothetical protein
MATPVKAFFPLATRHEVRPAICKGKGTPAQRNTEVDRLRAYTTLSTSATMSR